MSSEVRVGSPDEFFSHENQIHPPSISENGNLRTTTKSAIVTVLEKTANTTPIAATPKADVLLMDGAAVVHYLPPTKGKTFADYVHGTFFPHIRRQLDNYLRVDIVFDVYKENSLKEGARKSRGKGVRIKVSLNTPLPKSWPLFLNDPDNKSELFRLLAEESVSLSLPNKQLIMSFGDSVVCVPTRDDTDGISPCNHEEADSRLIVHLADAVAEGHKTFMIRTVDSDVVVLGVAAVPHLNLCQLWVSYGTGKDHRFLSLHDISAAIGTQKSLSLPFFHAYTGCDTVSAFHSIGKKTAWGTWCSFPEVTEAFRLLVEGPTEISDETMQLIERFTVLLYDRTSESNSVNEVRKHLFTAKGRTLQNIPPTLSALEQHVKRATLQGGRIWGHAQDVQLLDVSPDSWGWTSESGKWQPLWSSLPVASVSCRGLIRCGCVKGCTGRCKCAKAGLPCTALCLGCKGVCQNSAV